jgi:hypothetical protein
MKTCEDCAYWDDEYCKKIDSKLTPDTIIGFKEFFAQAEDCVHYMNSKEYQKKAMAGELVGKEEQIVKEKEIVREKEVIVKVRCSYCNNLYDETLDRCPHCGGRD